VQTDRTDGADPLPPPDPERLRTGAAALFLDLDGTLAAFQGRPELVGPDPLRTDRLRRLDLRLGGRLAILSGRTLADIDRILDGAVIAAAGVHGLERRRADGVADRRPAHPNLPEAERRMRAFAAAHTGLVVETKGPSVALHFRGAPGLADEVLDFTADLGAVLGLTVQDGAMVAELRTPGADKGDALLAFMTEAPFNGARPVMIGDDLTDEAAFGVAAALGGFGVLVGAPRPTKALSRLDDVGAVAAFIDRILAPAGERSPFQRGQAPCHA
jgi:trehalose 6-phosphate phosphatase